MPNGVTREQIDLAKQVNILDYVLAHESNNVKRSGNAHYLKDHDSLRISNGLWKWESQGIQELTRPVIEEFISEIRIYAADRIEIVFNYADEYAKAAELANDDNPKRRARK